MMHGGIQLVGTVSTVTTRGSGSRDGAAAVRADADRGVDSGTSDAELPTPWMAPDHVVLIVDDDRRVRESLIALLSSYDMHAIGFGSAAEYLAYPVPDVATCLILDIELPDISGLELHSRIAKGRHPHVVFVTGHGDIPSSVRAMKAGAVDFLTKPFEEADLMRAVRSALEQNRDSARRSAELEDLHRRASTLTPREREVLPLVASGLLNKQAASELGISEVTLQIHRGHLMKKMGAGSLADLVRMAGMLGIPVVRPPGVRG